MLRCRSGQIVARTATVAYAHASRRLTLLPTPLKRAAMLIGALSLLAVAGPVAAANAAGETSQITSPAGPTYTLNNQSEPSPSEVLKIEGTTNIVGTVALRCYYVGTKGNESLLLGDATPSGSGDFSLSVETKTLHIGPCVLRAVPAADTTAHPPGDAAEEAADPFHGPRIVGSVFRVFTENKLPYDYEVESNTLAGYYDFESVGDCGLDYSQLFAPSSLIPSDYLFDCNAALYRQDDPPSGSATRSELQIDGANAYGPATADYVNERIQEELKTDKEPLKPVPGAPQIAVTTTPEPGGLVTIHEVDPIVKCAPETVFPPTSTSCTSFVSTGVQLERTWQTSSANHVAWMTDTWRSTDGAAHSLNALYDQELVDAEETGGAYELPGDSTFSPATKGQMAVLPSGAGAIYYKEDAATPAGGDGIHPQGAIVYDTRPNNPLSVYRGTEAKEIYNGFEMPYQATIPAGGTYTLRMAFIQAYTLTEVETLAGEALASYHPTLTIGKPTNGETVAAPNVTVSGTASDSEGTPTLTVDGKAVSVGAGGAWSTSVTLNKGANTITAVANNRAGLTAEKSVSVTYTPVSPPPVKAHASQVGAAKGKNGEVTFSLTCKGTAGTTCEIAATLTTIEKTRHGKPVAVSARRHPRTRSEEVTAGSSSLTIPAGQKVTIAIQLNATGKSLLARFGALPVHLGVVQVSSGHRSTVIAQNLTVTPHRRPRHHHHHHHR
jgi:hypothetical protein